MSATYKAIEVTKPGVLTEVERPLRASGLNEVRIRVEACGVCHTDSMLVNAEIPNLTYPRVPGHEIIGRIDALGSNVKTRSVGQRVGGGICGGWDDTCLSCLRGDFVNCANAVLTGIMIDGGYAEVMIIEARATVTIPDGLEPVKAAPLLCAGVTTYNALAECGLACRRARRSPRGWRTRSPWNSIREKDGIQDRGH
jgi:D-arabinose 1-dehydrogenase-like Zn-dependent alcohol dehydrogenase